MALPEQFYLSGRITVVTGASRGIGRAVAIGLAEAGPSVVVAARSTEGLEETAARVRDRDSRAAVVPTDVTEQEGVRALVDAIRARFDRIDVLVNNAGINPAALGRPETVDPDGFRSDPRRQPALRVPVCLGGRGPARRGRGWERHQRRQRGGVVGLPSQHPYVASKDGLVGLTRSMARDWAPAVRVNALAPGYVRTDLLADVLDDEDLRASLVDRTPLDRLAEPSEIAGPAVFLASDAVSYLTGACLNAYGGWTAR